MLLYEVVDSFEAEKVSYALVGGYALALHGVVRATMDVDFILTLTQSDFEAAERALARIGLKSRLPIRAQDVIKMRKEYIEKRNMVAWSFVDYSNPSRQVDLLITKDLKKVKTQKISVGGRKIVVATAQELLKMKEEAGRPQDLLDIQNLKEVLHGKK